MKNAKNILLKYGITTACAGLLVWLFLDLRDFTKVADVAERYKMLADAFTIPGVILVMLAALVWISTDGFFDGLSYIFSRIGGMILPFYGAQKAHQTYYDYKMSKKDKRIKGYGFLFFVGLAFVAVAVVFTCLHASVYVPKT